jgi:quercetin dioxygenase-like cupin family protein
VRWVRQWDFFHEYPRVHETHSAGPPHRDAGTGPRLHRHPYEEVFVVLDGELEMTIGDEVATVGAGQIAVAPANVWHGFKAGPDGARSVNIHAAPRMVQEWAPRETRASGL